MAKRMLIDTTHPEETRVVVLSGKRLEEYDVETASKKQIKSNIYLAKVTRVEPSLQACFVDYGGNRHGFLAFSEIHPDYYRIPVADREALLAEQSAFERRGGPIESIATELSEGREGRAERAAPDPTLADAAPGAEQPADAAADTANGDSSENGGESGENGGESGENGGEPDARRAMDGPGNGAAAPVETVSGEDDDVDEDRPRRMRLSRRYKIQEVIKRRQIMLVQVTKEERGNKGAALTTYLSLAGRYCVLMPNTDRGGGISRRIANPPDRKRLKSVLEELDIPRGMAVIIRTAGAERTKAEVRRDYEYLLRLWDEIRELTLKSTAPALIYEEASLIKRAIRDMYTRDIDEIIVEGEEGYKSAKAFMRMLTPSHAKRVQQYKDPLVPLFHRYQVESQLDAIHNPVVQLKSGGYIVLNQTEALVAIDVNSGRATRERNIEETALKTNMEAAEEVARQLRLRDMAGLIVIDFIDMEESRHNAAVERKLKDGVRADRARIQMGRISPFGLLELSRQRMRPSVFEASTQTCRHCRGTGHVRSTESTALHVLRSIEEEGIRSRGSGLSVAVATEVALYILNQKRTSLAEVEARHGIRVFMAADDSLIPPDFRVERVEAIAPLTTPPPVSQASAETPEDEAQDEAAAREEAAEAPAAAAGAGAAGEEGRGGRRRPRRRRRGRREDGREEGHVETAAPDAGTGVEPAAAAEGPAEPAGEEPAEAGEPARDDGSEEARRRRRRGRRGGRRRARREDGTRGAAGPNGEASFEQAPEAEAQEEGFAAFEEPAPPAAEPIEEVPALDEPLPWDVPAPAQSEFDIPAAPHAEPARASELEPSPVPSADRLAAEPAPTAAAAGHAADAGSEAAPSEAAGSDAGGPTIHVVSDSPEDTEGGEPRRGWWRRLVKQ